MPVTLHQGEDLCVVCLEGEINIASAGKLKAVLLRALASGTGLRLDLERTTELDVTALQLLWAAEIEARKTRKVFTLAGIVPQDVSQAAGEAGFERFPFAVDAR
jgi:anti-anti-sigma regulatory factor